MAVDLTKINAINQRAQQLLQKPVATVPMQSTPTPRMSVTPTPTPMMSPTPKPLEVPKPSLFGKIAAPVKNVAQSALRALQVPSELTEKGITSLYGKQTYEDVYRQNKVPEIAVKPLAFGARMLLDPLNLIPFLKGGKILSKLGKVTGITEKVAPIVSKVKNFINPALNLPEELNYAQKMIPRNVALKTEEYVAKMKPMVEGMTTAGREAAAKMLQGADDANDVFMTLKSTERPIVKRFVVEAGKQRVQQLKDAYEAGLMTKKKFTEFMGKVGTYYHATDFARDEGSKLSRMFRSGVETATSYFRKKKGAKGFSLDAPLTVAKRNVKEFWDLEKAKVLEKVKVNPEWSVKLKKGMEAPVGFVKIGGEYLAGHRPLKGYAVKQEIFDALIKTQKIARGPVGDFVAGFNKVWKPIVTAYNPAFHAQNLLGNVYQMALGGVRSPKRFLQAAVGGIPGEERALARSGGVLNTGQVMESLGKDLGDVSALGKQNILQRMWGSKYNPAQWMSKLGSGIENNARTAMYNDAYQKALKAGKTAAQAAQDAFMKTNKYLFDYATGLGPREKQVRDFLPFYSWTRFNMPLQLSELFKQPAFFAAPGKLSRTVEPDRQGMPDERGYSIPTPWSGPDGGKIRYAPNLPMNSLFDAANPGKTLLNMVSPIKNLPVILANLAGNPAQEFGYGGPTGKPIIQPGLPVSEQAHDFADFLSRQFRPFRDITSSANIGGVPGLLKYLFGGFQNVNEQKNAINELYNQSNLRSVREKRASQLIKQGKLDRANRLLRSQQ